MKMLMLDMVQILFNLVMVHLLRYNHNKNVQKSRQIGKPILLLMSS